MRILFSLVFALLVLAQTARAEYPKPPIEAYGALPQVYDAQISPDGTKIATLVSVEGTNAMVVMGVDGQMMSAGFDTSRFKARYVDFYDNEHVILKASATTRTLGFRGQYEFSGSFSINTSTNKIKQLLKGNPDLYAAQSGLGDIIGRADQDGYVLMPAFVGERWSDPRLNLMKVNLKSPKGRQFRGGTADTRDWFVDGRGQVLARERYDNRTNLYQVEALKDGKWTTIFEEQDEIIPYNMLGVMPDETGLVFKVVKENGFDALMKLGFDGEIEGPIFEPRGQEIEAFYRDDNRKLVGVRYSGLLPEYDFLDPAIENSIRYVSDKLPSATIFLDSWSDDRDTILYSVFAIGIGDVWLVHKPSTNKLTVAANRRPDIPASAIGEMFNIEYQARDGLKIPAIITTPPGHQLGEGSLLPALVMPHGGPSAYDRFDFDWMAQYFANRGYMVVQPNFRGSSGFGREFERAGRGEWGAKMQDDISDAILKLAKAGFIDADRVCIAGANYGGYAALAGAVFTPELYKCVVAIAPVSDLNRMLQDKKRERGGDHWVVSYWEDVMAAGDARRAKLRAISPYNFADAVEAPVLLIHGDDDTVVPYHQSTRMRSALKKANKAVELVKLKGEDHWLSVPETRMQALRAMDAFITEHLPPDP